MPEYIERESVEKIIKKLYQEPEYQHTDEDFYAGVCAVAGGLATLPTADVAEVVRCKDCVNWGGVTFGFVCRKFSGLYTKICMHADNFCSYGERKGGCCSNE